jgi:hypothetical protein
MEDVLGAIGNTPLVRLKKVSKTAGLQCELCKFRIGLFIPCTTNRKPGNPLVRLRKVFKTAGLQCELCKLRIG